MKISAPRDDNRVVAMMVTRSDDGYSPMTVYVTSAHKMIVQDGTTGSGVSSINAERDNNFEPVLLGVSSADGVTPVPIWGDFNTGAILVDST